MMHKAWSSIEEVPYCFSRSYVKLQGHTAKKLMILTQIGRFRTVTPVWIHWWLWNVAKLETAKKRCPIVFQGHPSNFKVTRDKTSPILTQIGRFRTIGRSQLSNPSDLPCFILKCNDRDPLYHQYVSVTVKCENQMERIFIISFPMFPVGVQSCHKDHTHLRSHFRPINKNRNSSIGPKFKIFQTTINMINIYFVIIMALEMILGNHCFITRLLSFFAS